MLNYQRIREIDINALQRTNLGEALKFSEVIPSIEKIATALLFFEGRENNLTSVEKEPILVIAKQFLAILTSIEQFQVEPNENFEQSKNRRMVIVKKVYALHNLLIQSTLPLITHLKFDDTKIQETISNIQSKILQIDKQFTTQIQNFENNTNSKISEFGEQIRLAKSTLAETEQIKLEARNFSVEKLVDKYGAIFEQQAARHKAYALISLALFVVSILGLIGGTYLLFNGLLMGLSRASFTTEYVIVNSVFRLTLILIASVFVKESIKSFNANMHLYNLNSHRHNALLSFETLIKNVNDGTEIRDKIIQEIAQTIYANQDDGYLSSSKKSISTSEIIELIKAINK